VRLIKFASRVSEVDTFVATVRRGALASEPAAAVDFFANHP
jgi:hypothetical protein